MSTDSSDSDDTEDTQFTEIDSSPDGIKLRQKILTVIKRIRINRKSGTRLRNGKTVKGRQIEAETNSTEDKEFQPVLESNDYNLSWRKPGLAVFIINSRFEHQPYRPFAETDCHYMVKLFKHLGFEVRLLKDLKGQDLWRELIAIQTSITTEYDCFVCVISSHGAELPLSRFWDSQRKLREHVIYTRDGSIPTDKILNIFNDEGCKNLQGKPRIFFIQACRCVMGADEDLDVDKGVDIEVTRTRIHEQDYPVFHFKRRERIAWSDSGKGGWLMYCIYKVFKGLLNAEFKTDLLYILVGVCDKMARGLAAATPSDPLRNRTKSAATIYHMLTNDIYLQPKRVMKQSVCSGQFEGK